MPPLHVKRSQTGDEWKKADAERRLPGKNGHKNTTVLCKPICSQAPSAVQRRFQNGQWCCKERGRDRSESIRRAAEQIPTGGEHHVHVSTTVAAVHIFTSFHQNLLIVYHSGWKKSTLGLRLLLRPNSIYDQMLLFGQSEERFHRFLFLIRTFYILGPGLTNGGMHGGAGFFRLAESRRKRRLSQKGSAILFAAGNRLADSKPLPVQTHSAFSTLFNIFCAPIPKKVKN